MRSSASRRTADVSSECGSRPEPICAPAPWSPPHCSSSPAFARRIVLPRDSSAEQNWPLRRRSRTDTCYRSWYCLRSSFCRCRSARYPRNAHRKQSCQRRQSARSVLSPARSSSPRLGQYRDTGQQSILGACHDFFLPTLFQALNPHRNRLNDLGIGLDRQRNIGRQRHLIHSVGRQALDLVAGDPGTLLTCDDIFDSKNVHGAASYPPHAFTGQVAHGTLLLWQDGAGRQYAQAQQMRQIAGVGFIPAMFDALVLLDRSGVGQLQRETHRLQTINQPVPVEGGLHHDCHQFIFPGHRHGQYFRHVVGQSLLRRFTAVGGRLGDFQIGPGTWVTPSSRDNERRLAAFGNVEGWSAHGVANRMAVHLSDRTAGLGPP